MQPAPRRLVAALRLGGMPVEFACRLAHGHALEVGELEELALLPGELVDRLMNLVEAVLLKRDLLGTLAQVVGQARGQIRGDHVRGAALRFEQARRSAARRR